MVCISEDMKGRYIVIRETKLRDHEKLLEMLAAIKELDQYCELVMIE